MGKKWVPLESNPDVLNEFARGVGAPIDKIAFCDVFGLDEELLQMVPQPVKALVVLFPITDATEAAKDAEEAKLKEEGQVVSASVWYTKQTVSNACGTVAMLHAFGNSDVEFASGSFLEKFFAEAQSLSPTERAKMLERPEEGQPDIEAAHQEAAQEGQTTPPPEEENILLHFVCFVHRDGFLYELDGRKFDAINHGATTEESLLKDACGIVKKLMDSSGDVRFNLMALAPLPSE